MKTKKEIKNKLIKSERKYVGKLVKEDKELEKENEQYNGAFPPCPLPATHTDTVGLRNEFLQSGSPTPLCSCVTFVYL